MRRPVLAFAALLTAIGLTAATDSGRIFEITDPQGDDHGDGTLIYPMRDDMQPGDLDLLALTATADAKGTWFEATFARPIRPTARRTIDIGGGSLDQIARLGFYTFNLDLYVDTDRVTGSGSTQALPGRRASIAAANAWERTICLTPRPYEARGELQRILLRFARRDMKEKEGRINDARLREIEREIAHDVETRVFFPTLVRIVGPKIRFFVPAGFLAGPAKADWAYAIAVSGADIIQKIDVGSALRISTPDPDSLMILPVASGRHADRFGGAREDDPLYPPLVDIVVPSGMSQEKVLQDYDPATNRPVALPGVVPSAQTPDSGASRR